MLFKDVEIDAEFVLNGEVYKKVTPKYINCCTLKYNALKVSNPKEGVVLLNNVEVTPNVKTEPTTDSENA